MRKIITAEQTKAADAFTISNEPIPSIELMERASKAFADAFSNFFSLQKKVLVLAGTGNNGGDGLAVARLLRQMGYQVEINLIRISGQVSPDCQINFDRLERSSIKEISGEDEIVLAESDVIIDAIFGSGLNRPVSGFVAEMIRKINSSNLPVVSIDIPSGLLTDQIDLEGAVINAAKTITFQRPKLTFLLPETGSYAGEWTVSDIGLDEEFIQKQDSHFYYQELVDMVKLLPERKKFQHKGDFGRVQVFSGSLGKIGAAFLCAKAVLRTGAGLLTVHIPKIGNEVMQTALPEAMVTLDKEEHIITNGELFDNTDTVCIGPGIGQNQKTSDWLERMIKNAKGSMVLDADALNLIARMEDGYKNIPIGSVITPHVGEFDRLFGIHLTSLDRLATIKSVASEQKIVIVLKGAHSAVGLPNGDIVFNTTGNAGMATAGSGDVLSGIITGLLAQGMSAIDAARLGVYLHGLAGDLAAKKNGKMSLMASDLLNELPDAITNVERTEFI